MPLLMLKDLPRYQCLCEASHEYPSLRPDACDAFLNLLRTGDDVFAAESRFLTAHGVSQGRFTVLMLLNCRDGEPLNPAELADEAGVTRATMTGLLDTLAKDGLIHREADPSDRRGVLVHLTPTGRTFVAGLLPEYFSAVSHIMQPLAPAEQRQLVALLQKLQDGLAPARAARTREPLATA